MRQSMVVLLVAAAAALPVDITGHDSYSAAELPDDTYLAAASYEDKGVEEQPDIRAGEGASVLNAIADAKATTPPLVFDILTAVSSLLGQTIPPEILAVLQSRVLEVGQALQLGDLEPNQFRVQWQHFTVTGPTGIVLQAKVARPDSPAADALAAIGCSTAQSEPPPRCFPVIVMPNSWALNILEYTFKQQEWASKGYVVVQYQTRGWYGSGGYVDVAGPADMVDVKAVLDEIEARADGWRANTSRLAMAGVSYGGGISLLAAAHDPRIKAVACLSGWGNLTSALAPQAAPNWVYYEALTASAEIVTRMDPEAHRMWDNLKHWRNVDELLTWADRRSAASHADRLCAGGLPVLLSNNAEDGLFATDDAFALRQLLHGAGCRVRLIIHEGMHAMAELPALLGVDSILAYQPPAWEHTLSFLDAHLRPGAAPDYLATTPPLLFQLRNPIGYFAPPRYLGFNEWPSAQAEPLSLVLDSSGLGQESGVGAPSGEQDGGQCEVTLAFSRATGINAAPLVGEFVMVAVGSYTTTLLTLVNPSAAHVFLSRPAQLDVRLCGLPNASLDVRAFSAINSTHHPRGAPETPRFQLAVYLWDVEPAGMLAGLITRGVRNVWRPGELSPGGFDGPGQPLTVEMPAVCVDLPRGHMVGLGVALFDPAFIPANDDPALRVRVACDGQSRLELPVVKGTSPGFV